MEASLTWETPTPDEVAEALREFGQVVPQKLERAGRDIGVRIRRDAQAGAPVDETRLRDSIEELVSRVGETLIRITVGTNVEYGEYHEFGTDPFFPPPSELRDWARRRLGDADAAFPVAKSISETGISEKRFLRDALQENLEWALDRIVTAIQSAYDEVFG